MDNIIEKIKKIQYKSNVSLQKDLETLNLPDLRTIAQNLKLIETEDKSKSKKLIKFILAFYKNSKCSVQKPCENLDEDCNLETGKCENLKKATIIDQYGQQIKVIGSPENIENAQNKIDLVTSSSNIQVEQKFSSIIDYRLQSFLQEGMTNVDDNGDCFFICVQKLLKLTHDVEYDVSTVRDKLSQCIKFLTLTVPPIIDQESLLNEFDNISSIQEYMLNISTNGWAGEPEIIAASSLFNKIIIVKTLKLNIPDRIYFPSVNLPNRNVQPGLWIIYHTNKETDNIGNHYQYKGNKADGLFTGSVSDVNLLEEILDMISGLEEGVSPSMSLISADGKQYAGDADSLKALTNSKIIKLKSTVNEGPQKITLPLEEEGIDKPNESDIVKSLKLKSEDEKSINQDINEFLYPNES